MKKYFLLAILLISSTAYGQKSPIPVSGGLADPGSNGVIKRTAENVTAPATATDVSTPSQCADAGASDTYACNLAPALASYVVGTKLRFFANTANTAGASINYNSLGALTIVKMPGGITTALATGDINAGQWVEGTIATGSNFQMTSQVGGSAGITNGAGNNVVPKSDGTNLVASRITDDGTLITIQTDASSIVLNSDTVNIDNDTIITDTGGVTLAKHRGQGQFSSDRVTLGDIQSLGNGYKLFIDDATKTFNVNGDGVAGATVNIVGDTLIFQSADGTRSLTLEDDDDSSVISLAAAASVGLATPTIKVNATVTPAATTSVQEINKSAGSVNIAAAESSKQVNNSTVTADSIILCTIATNDATAVIKNCVAGSGSFVITLNAAATAETRVNFWVLTPQ